MEQKANCKESEEIELEKLIDNLDKKLQEIAKVQIEEIKKTQTKEELHRNVMKASKRKILRRQLELLAEYSHLYPEEAVKYDATRQMLALHKELIKIEKIFPVGILVALFGFLYLMKRIERR